MEKRGGFPLESMKKQGMKNQKPRRHWGMKKEGHPGNHTGGTEGKIRATIGQQGARIGNQTKGWGVLAENHSS